MTLIYFNPKCSKCRIAKKFLEKSGETIEIREYLTNPPTVQELKEVLGKLHLSAESIVRKKEDEWKEFRNKKLTENEIIKILIKNPKLIQRPIIIKGDLAVIGRDEESLQKIAK